MNARTANSHYHFELPNLSYIDAKWEEPNLRTQVDVPARRPGWLARKIEAYRTARRNSRAAYELATMSDYELMDIGINRSDLIRVFEPSLNQDLRQRGT